MKIFKIYSIKDKIIAVAIMGFAISIITAAIYAAISFKGVGIESSHEISKLITDIYTQKIKSKIDSRVKTARYFNKIFLHNGNPKFNKKETLNVLLGILDENNYKRLYQIWEPDIYSIADTSIKDIATADTISSFAPIITKTSEGNIISIADKNDIKLTKDIFEYIKNTHNTYISEPYPEINENKTRMIISIYTPLISRDKFMGITGFDIVMDDIYNIINEPDYYSSDAGIMLLSEKGNIIYMSGKDRFSGKNIKSYKSAETNFYKKYKEYGIIKSDRKIAGSINTLNIAHTNKKWEVFAYVPQNIVIRSYLHQIYISVIIAAVLMLLGLTGLIIFINRAFKPVKKISESLNKLRVGELEDIEINESKNEFSEIINSLNAVSQNIKEVVSVSNRLAEGKYNTKVKVKSKNDFLSLSVNNLSKKLSNIEKENLDRKRSADIQLWIRKGRFEVVAAHRVSANDIHEISYNVIKSMVNYSGAVLGGIYVNSTPENPKIRLVAAFAYGSKKTIKVEFMKGEGIVGTCAIEKKKIILNKLPKDYLIISSGLGDAPPGYLAVLPVFNNNVLIGFIEIAFVKTPEDYKIEFIEQLSENVGAWIEAALTQERTTTLLQNSQKQTKELSEKEAELNNKINELEKIQKKYAEHAAEMQSMLTAVNNTLLTVEYTPDGVVINANDMFLDFMGFKLEDIINKNVFDMVEGKEREELMDIVNKVKVGKKINRTVKRFTNYGDEKQLSASYTPYYNANNEITRVIFFAFDIT